MANQTFQMSLDSQLSSLPRLKHPRLWFGLGYLALVVVAYVSLMPMPNVGVSDKLLHYLTYAGLSAGFSTLVRFNRQVLWVVSGLILFGVLIEFLQGLTGYRFMEAYDVLANSVGVFCGLLVRLTPLPRWFRQLESRLFTA
jgi:VanZ family protein